MTNAETTNSAHHSSRRRPWFRIVLVAVVILLAGLWLASWLQHRLTHVSEKDARIKTHEITVASRLDGRVRHFDHERGDRLQEGDSVARLYSKPDRLELRAKRAKVEQIENAITTQKSRIRLAKRHLAGGIAENKDLLEADRAARSAAKARMIRARKKTERSQRLYKQDSISKQQRDVDQYTYRSARGEYQRARRQVELDQSALANAKEGLLTKPPTTLPNPDVLQNKVTAMQSRLDEAKADLAHQQTRLDDMEVTSPVDGVIDKTFIDAAEYVSAGQPIVMMHDPADVWVEARMKETKIQSLAVGQSVAIDVDARPDTDYSGHVKTIGHAATSQFALLPDPNPSGNFTKITQRIPVRIAIDHGPRKELSPGMMVEVDVTTDGSGDHG